MYTLFACTFRARVPGEAGQAMARLLFWDTLHIHKGKKKLTIYVVRRV